MHEVFNRFNYLSMSRINRTQFAIRYILSTIFLLVAYWVLTNINTGFLFAGELIFLILVIILFIYILPISLKRSRDAGANIFLAFLLCCIPLVNIIFLFYLLFAPSTEESKKIVEEEKILKEKKEFELYKKEKREEKYGYIVGGLILIGVVIYFVVTEN